MASIPDSIIKSVNKYLAELLQRGFNINAAYIFGSYATGKWDEWSDIDVAIISDQFSGNRFLDKEKIRDILLKTDLKISPFPFRSDDFNHSLLHDEIIKKGIRVS